MSIWVRILQVVVGIYFVAIGVMHFIVPEGLPAQMAWMYDLPTWAHIASGTAEIVAGVVLTVPALTRSNPMLVALAAAGLAVMMLLAAGWHVSRGEIGNVAGNLVMAAVLALIAVKQRRAVGQATSLIDRE